MFVLFGVGVLSVIGGIYRVLRRSGMNYDGKSGISVQSYNKQKEQRAKFWAALFDDRFRADQIILIFGGVSLALAIIVLNIIT